MEDFIMKVEYLEEAISGHDVMWPYHLHTYSWVQNKWGVC